MDKLDYVLIHPGQLWDRNYGSGDFLFKRAIGEKVAVTYISLVGKIWWRIILDTCILKVHIHDDYALQEFVEITYHKGNRFKYLIYFDHWEEEKANRYSCFGHLRTKVCLR